MDYKNINDYEILYLIGESSDYKDVIFEKYKPLVYELCNKYYYSLKKCGMEFDDLVQEGMIALNRAIDTYDSDNSLFYSYARVCVDRHLGTFYRISTTKRKNVLNFAVSVNKTVNDNEDVTINDLISDCNNVYNVIDINLDLVSFKNKLSEKEAQVFELRWNGFSYNEISSLIDMKIKNVDYYIQRIKRKIHCYF